MLLVFIALLLFLTAILLVSTLRLTERVPSLLAFFLTAYTQVVILSELISLFHWLTKTGIVIGQIVLVLMSFIVWYTSGKPAIFASFRIMEGIGEIRTIWRNRNANGSIIISTGIALFIGLILTGIILLTRDPDGDVLFYHFPKIALWVQNQSMFFTRETAAFIEDVRITGSPPNSNLSYVWIYLLSGSLKFIEIVELAAVLPLITAGYGIALELTGKRKASYLAMLTYLSFAIVIWDLQHAFVIISSTAFFVSGLYFLLRADKYWERFAVIFCCLGFGLAVGAKATVYFALPVTAILLIIHLVRGVKVKGWDFLGFWLGAGILSLVLLSASIYFQNVFVYGSPIPQRIWGGDVAIDQGLSYYLRCGQHNLLRFSYDLTVPDPIPSTWYETSNVVTRQFWQSIGEWSGAPLNDRFCSNTNSFVSFKEGRKIGFNFLYLPLLLGGIWASIRAARRQRDYYRFALWAIWAGFSLFMTSLMAYHFLNFRYFALPAALLSILLVDLIQNLENYEWLLTGLMIIALLCGVAFSIDGAEQRFGSWQSFLRAFRGEDIADQRIYQDLLPSDGDVLLTFHETNNVSLHYFGYELTRDVYFSDCEHLPEKLGDPDLSYFAYGWLHPADSFYACLSRFEEEGKANQLRAALEPYQLVYEAWIDQLFIRFYERAIGNEEASDNHLYPTTFPPGQPVIRVYPPFEGVIGAGPIFLNTRSKTERGEIIFSVRSDGMDTPVAITIELYGLPCSTDGTIQVDITDEWGETIFTEYLPVVERDMLYLDMTMNLVLPEGITSFRLDDNSTCPANLDPHLFLNRVLLTAGITSDEITLEGEGWYSLEVNDDGLSRRWVNNDAGFSVNVAQSGDYSLLLGSSSGPGNENQPLDLLLLDETGGVLDEVIVQPEWSLLEISLGYLEAGNHHFTFHTDDGGATPITGDARIMNFLVTEIGLMPDE